MEIRAFALAEPESEQFIAAFEIDSDREIEGFLDDAPFVARLDEERVQIEYKPSRLKRHHAPFLHSCAERLTDRGSAPIFPRRL